MDQPQPTGPYIAHLEHESDLSFAFSFQDDLGDWIELDIPKTPETEAAVQDARLFHGDSPDVLLEIPQDPDSDDFRIRLAPPGFNETSASSKILLPRHPNSNAPSDLAAYILLLSVRLDQESTYSEFLCVPQPTDWSNAAEVDSLLFLQGEAFRADQNLLERFEAALQAQAGGMQHPWLAFLTSE